MRIQCLAAGLIVSAASSASAFDTYSLWAVCGGSGGSLHQVDPDNGSDFIVGRFGFSIDDLAGDIGPGRSGDLWAVNGLGPFGNETSSTLYRLDPQTQSVLDEQSIDAPSGITTLAIHPLSGEFFGVSAETADAGTALYRIDPTDGATSLIGDLSTPLTSLGFDQSGRLFGSYQSSLFEISWGDASLETVTDELNVFRFEDLAFDPSDNTMLAVGYGSGVGDTGYWLYEVNPDTGVTTPLGPSVFRPNGLAFSASVDMVTGDYDDSGTVDQGDLDLVLNNWGMHRARLFYPSNEPFNTNSIDQEELDRVLNNWGSSVAPNLESFDVPEPAMSVGLMGLWGVLGRQRDKR